VAKEERRVEESIVEELMKRMPRTTKINGGAYNLKNSEGKTWKIEEYSEDLVEAIAQRVLKEKVIFMKSNYQLFYNYMLHLMTRLLVRFEMLVLKQ